MRDVVDFARPTWVIGENVAGIDGLGLDRVLSDLEALGYQVRTFEIPACAVGAPHVRNRAWIVAYSEGNRRQSRRSRDCRNEEAFTMSAGNGPLSDMGDPDGIGNGADRTAGAVQGAAGAQQTKGNRSARGPWHAGAGGRGHWDDAEWISGPGGQARRVKPGIRLLADGVPGRVARLRALGNAVIPQVVERIGRAVMSASGGATDENGRQPGDFQR